MATMLTAQGEKESSVGLTQGRVGKEWTLNPPLGLLVLAGDWGAYEVSDKFSGMSCTEWPQFCSFTVKGS